MSITIISSREFNHDIGKAKKAAQKGPVIITDRGNPAHVLMTVEQYQHITGTQKNILDLLAMPGVADIDFDPPRLGNDICRPADLS
ncbi:type II toxin-antitoxin system Phd/YefM family antitoxin [Desulfocastanea catecholica]